MIATSFSEDNLRLLAEVVSTYSSAHGMWVLPEDRRLLCENMRCTICGRPAGVNVCGLDFAQVVIYSGPNLFYEMSWKAVIAWAKKAIETGTPPELEPHWTLVESTGKRRRG